MSRHRSSEPRARRRPIPGSSSLRILLVGGVGTAVLVGVGVAGASFFSREKAPGPGDAVQAWLTATKAGDLPAVQGLTCAEQIDEDEIDGDPATSAAWSITGEATAADTAAVTAEVTYPVEGFLQHDTWTFELVREADAWKLCGLRRELTDPDTPRTALADWMAAAVANDLATVQSLTCAAQAGGITPDEIAAAQGVTYEVTEVAKVDETTASVAFTIQVQRNGGPVRFDERWLFVYEEPPAVGAEHAWKACGPVRA